MRKMEKIGDFSIIKKADFFDVRICACGKKKLIFVQTNKRAGQNKMSI